MPGAGAQISLNFGELPSQQPPRPSNTASIWLHKYHMFNKLYRAAKRIFTLSILLYCLYLTLEY
jgi:hypothetical protein